MICWVSGQWLTKQDSNSTRVDNHNIGAKDTMPAATKNVPVKTKMLGLDGLKAGRNPPVAPSAQSGSGRNQQLKLKPAERKKRHNGGNYEWTLARGHGQSPPLYGV